MELVGTAPAVVGAAEVHAALQVSALAVPAAHGCSVTLRNATIPTVAIKIGVSVAANKQKTCHSLRSITTFASRAATTLVRTWVACRARLCTISLRQGFEHGRGHSAMIQGVIVVQSTLMYPRGRV